MDADTRLFRALADGTRRSLLDRLRHRNGQTLRELCDGLSMTRQSATQHLDVLEDVHLVSTVRRGRERFHYLNPVPLHEIHSRWIDRFDQPRLDALDHIKQRAEDAMTDRPSFVYVTYIRATPEVVWDALTDADLTAEYWGHSNVSDWQEGSSWEHVRTDGSGIADVVGTVIESSRPRRLVSTWADPTGAHGGEPSRVSFDIEASGEIVRLTVTHELLHDPADRDNAARGWAAVLANLKSLLETGEVLPERPWEMA